MPSNEKVTVEQIKALLGAPRLIKSESEEAYWKWWDAFAEERQPEFLSDWLDVNQLAIKHWEQERLSRCNNALVDNSLRTALRHLLQPFVGQASGGRIVIADKVARDYYSADEEDSEEAREKVASCGITDDDIMAEAIQLRGDAIIQLDRMDKHRAYAKRAIQKELDRRSNARRDNPSSKAN